jgi:hypothetical protein
LRSFQHSAGCYVYALLCRDAHQVHVRIGLSDDPASRLAKLRSECVAPPAEMLTMRMACRQRARFVLTHLRDELQDFGVDGTWYRCDVTQVSGLQQAMLRRVAFLFHHWRLPPVPFQSMDCSAVFVARRAAYVAATRRPVLHP